MPFVLGNSVIGLVVSIVTVWNHLLLSFDAGLKYLENWQIWWLLENSNANLNEESQIGRSMVDSVIAAAAGVVVDFVVVVEGRLDYVDSRLELKVIHF